MADKTTRLLYVDDESATGVFFVVNSEMTNALLSKRLKAAQQH